MNFVEAYYKACTERNVPSSVKAQVWMEIKDKSPEEQDRIREEWAKIIMETYPPRKRHGFEELKGNDVHMVDSAKDT